MSLMQRREQLRSPGLTGVTLPQYPVGVGSGCGSAGVGRANCKDATLRLAVTGTFRRETGQSRRFARCGSA